LADQGRMVKAWFQKAATDLKVVKLVKDQASDVAEASVFHAQQAAEKSIKGFLAFHKVRFPKTHSIEELLKLVAQVDANLQERLKPALILTEYVTKYRYPSSSEEPVTLSRLELEKAFVLANLVFQEMSAAVRIQIED
jgi:HEPN domain-containing protein